MSFNIDYNYPNVNKQSIFGYLLGCTTASYVVGQLYCRNIIKTKVMGNVSMINNYAKVSRHLFNGYIIAAIPCSCLAYGVIISVHKFNEFKQKIV